MVNGHPTDLSDLDYLGDGVYAGHDSYQVWVYTHNGERVQQRIALDPRVLAELVNYARRTGVLR